MWPSFITFSVSFFGLVALFAFKGVEERGTLSTPLAPLRKHGDRFIANGVMRLVYVAHHARRRIHERVLSWLKVTFRRVETFTVTRVHVLAARLHRYLMRRQKALNKQNEEHVSAHLKVMVEAKKTAMRSNESEGEGMMEEMSKEENLIGPTHFGSYSSFSKGGGHRPEDLEP